MCATQERQKPEVESGSHPERGDHGNHETAEQRPERDRRDGRDVCLGNTHIMDQRVTFSTN